MEYMRVPNRSQRFTARGLFEGLFLVLAGMALLSLAATPLCAGVIASSTFDINAEGWTNGSFDGPTASATAVNYLSTGGNPGGQIQVYDNYDWNAFLAPSQFLGNQSAAYLGSLTFDVYDVYVDSVPSPAVMISDGSTFLYSPLTLDSTVGGPPFNTLSVQFQASTGWHTDISGSSPATEAEMQTVLAHLQILAIEADWHSGDDDVHLDNVNLVSGASGVPEPATGILALGAGLCLLLAKRRKLV
jgi:hypothetical protein